MLDSLLKLSTYRLRHPYKMYFQSHAVESLSFVYSRVFAVAFFLLHQIKLQASNPFSKCDCKILHSKYFPPISLFCMHLIFYTALSYSLHILTVGLRLQKSPPLIQDGGASVWDRLQTHSLLSLSTLCFLLCAIYTQKSRSARCRFCC